MIEIQHPGWDSARYSMAVLPEDSAGQVEETIKLMREYVRADVKSPQIQRDLAELKPLVATGVSPEQAVWQFVHGRVRFHQDESRGSEVALDPRFSLVEVLTRPADLSVMRDSTGDCDDFAMYTACLLMGLGRRVSFVTVAGDPREPERDSHVYVASYDMAGNRVPVDASHGPRAGWEVPNPYRITEWPVENSWPYILALAFAGYQLLKKVRW